MAFSRDDRRRDSQDWLLWSEKHAILPVKWLTLAICILLAVLEPTYKGIPSDLFALIVFYASSNLLFSYLIYLNRVERRQVRMVSAASFLVDVGVVTLFVYLTGGINSPFYILYFLVILRGAGFFDSALGNLVADVIVSFSYVGAIFFHDRSLAFLEDQRFLHQIILVWAVILMAWVVFRVQNRLKIRLLDANMQLSIQKEYDEDVLASMSNCVIATDRDMRLIRINRAAREMLGLPPRTEGEDVYVLKNELGKLLESLREGAMDVQDKVMAVTVRPGQAVTLRVTANAIVAEDGSFLGSVCVFEDVSHVRRLEEQLFRSEKLASVGELAAGVAHEIGNPISIIKSCADLLLHELKRGGDGAVDSRTLMELRDDIEVIAGEAERCNHIVRELLSFSQPEAGEFARLDVNEIVERAVSLVRYQKAPAEVELVYRLAGDLPPVETDENLLTQALVNLLLNAVQAMSRKGRVEAVTQLVREDGRPWVRVDIIDEGCGIPENQRDRIFTPFFTTKEKGTGLGLSIVHRIVERLQGQLRLTSEVGRGTTFSVFLPPVLETEAEKPDGGTGSASV